MRILVIEDDLDVLSNLERALKEEGYFVDTASDGEEAAYKLREWEYDVIILDLMLPDVSGEALLLDFRQRGKATPILVISAKSKMSDRLACLNAGADDYLLKPYDFDELLARVRALIRRDNRLTTEIFSLHDCSIDLQNRIVNRNGLSVDLTRQEFALVSLLLHRRGRVVQRDFLLDRIYDKQDRIQSNLLDVLICKLRQKLGKDCIQTRRGHGYLIPK